MVYWSQIMAEKKRRAAARPVRIETRISDILVARNRSAEPYLHLFSVSPENVTQEHLGRLVGVFSVSDRSDSSAYIGNVIASVAKKEYFANTRRDAIEGFESSLHRANLALSEIVKNGDTRFMGRLHGVLAAIEDDRIHFSVTGNAAILLFRDGSLMDIGEGLASEDAATHPLKTFVEISSGQLLPGDCLLLVSPEIFTLFSPRELAQNARRLVPEGRFVRFLETAMINELKTGSALVVTVAERKTRRKPEPKRAPSPKREKRKETNFFSERIFRDAAAKRARHFLEAEETDEQAEKKPGKETAEDEQRAGDAIHVEGDAPPDKEGHPFITALQWKAEDALIRFRRGSGYVSQWLRDRIRETTHAIGRAIGDGTRSIGHAARSATRDRIERIRKRALPRPKKKKRAAKKRKDTDARSVESNPILKRALEVTKAYGARSTPGHKRRADAKHGERKTRPDRFGETIRAGWHAAWPKIRNAGRLASSALVLALRTVFGYVSARISRLSVRWRLIGIALIAFVATFAFFGIRNHFASPSEPETTPVVVIEKPEPAFPPDDEPGAVPAEAKPVSNAPSDTVAPILLGDRLFAVTGTGIVETSSGDFSALPSDSPITFAAGMDDLALIFLMTESGALFSYAPSNGSFTRNDIDLPEGFRSAGIGTFLTYLYLLDSNTGTIYRFPRAEGGFGERSPWNREPIESNIVSLAINSAIYTVSGDDILSLFRGRPTEGFSLERPATPLSVSAICAHEEVPEHFAVLDAPAKRMLLYEDTGALTRQYFHESFEGMTACSLSETGTEIAVSSSETMLTLSLKE